MVYAALNEKSGLVIEGIIRLGPAGARIFYWVIAALAAVFVLFALFLTFHRLVNPQVLVLESDSLLLPGRMFQREPIRVPYKDIQHCSDREVYSQRFLQLSAHGRKYVVKAALFSDHESYNAVREFLISHAQK
jgi:hypothetical protein